MYWIQPCPGPSTLIQDALVPPPPFRMPWSLHPHSGCPGPSTPIQDALVPPPSFRMYLEGPPLPQLTFLQGVNNWERCYAYTYQWSLQPDYCPLSSFFHLHTLMCSCVHVCVFMRACVCFPSTPIPYLILGVLILCPSPCVYIRDSTCLY